MPLAVKHLCCWQESVQNCSGLRVKWLRIGPCIKNNKFYQYRIPSPAFLWDLRVARLLAHQALIKKKTWKNKDEQWAGLVILRGWAASLSMRRLCNLSLLDLDWVDRSLEVWTVSRASLVSRHCVPLEDVTCPVLCATVHRVDTIWYYLIDVALSILLESLTLWGYWFYWEDHSQWLKGSYISWILTCFPQPFLMLCPGYFFQNVSAQSYRNGFWAFKFLCWVEIHTQTGSHRYITHIHTCSI